MPVPESELPLLSTLVQVRTKLTALKKDRTEYVRAADVLEIYKEVLQVGTFAFSCFRRISVVLTPSLLWLQRWRTVTRLNAIREANERSFKEEQALRQHTAASLSGRSGSTDGASTPTPEQATQQHEMNRVDTTLADVFQLLSLFFLTIGKSRSAPATYCQLATMQVCSSGNTSESHG